MNDIMSEIDIQQSNAQIIFNRMARLGRVPVMKYIRQRFEVDLVSALYAACETSQIEVIHYLIDEGVDVTVEGNCPMHIAIAYGHMAVVNLLQEKGGRLSNSWHNLIVDSARNGNLEMVQYLISDVQYQTKGKFSCGCFLLCLRIGSFRRGAISTFTRCG